MKHDPLSPCPDRADAAIWRVSFDTGSRAGQKGKLEDRTHSAGDPGRSLFARVRVAIRRRFRRSAPDHECLCDVDARLLELETHKLNMQHLGNLHY